MNKIHKPSYLTDESWNQLRDEVVKRMIPGAAATLWFETGRALMAVQMAEGSLLALTQLVHSTPLMNQNQWLELFQKLRKLTSGQLAQKLHDHTRLASTLTKDVERLCDERNWLAHPIWEENGRDLYEQSRFDQLLHRLEALRLLAQGVSVELQKIAEEWCHREAIPQSILVENHRRMRLWTFGEGEDVLPPRTKKQKPES